MFGAVQFPFPSQSVGGGLVTLIIAALGIFALDSMSTLGLASFAFVLCHFDCRG